jgi:uncharacterized protein
MERNIMWTPWDTPGLEHLRLVWYDDGIVADGVIIGYKQGLPFRARYAIRCDILWNVREVRIDLLDQTSQRIELLADGEGHWTDSSGIAMPALDGCRDVDISATPFTNTLPIRRMALRPGETADLVVAYIAVPEMEVAPEPQRYICLAAREQDGRYRYESLDGGFTAELAVDLDGLVVDYPELFRRVKLATS